MKAVLAEEYRPVRAICIRDFILKCLERRIPLHSCMLVYQQTRANRVLFRRELRARGIPAWAIGRALATAELKVKELLAKVQVHENLPNQRLAAVQSFFKKYEKDTRMVELMKKKNRTSALPEQSDMEILAQALTLQNLFFVTTDDHFGILRQELEQQFGFVLVHDDNALQKLSAWRWN